MTYPSSFPKDAILKLRSDVELITNNDGHCIVMDPKADQQFICDEISFRCLHSLKQGMPVDELIELMELLSVTAKEIDVILARCAQSGLLEGYASSPKNGAVKKALRSPFAVKVPLANPTRLLSWLSPVGTFVFSTYYWLFVAILLVTVLFLLPDHWAHLEQHWEARVFTLSNGGLMVLAYLFLKVAHEIGHGLAVRRFGGDVTECGIYFLVFFPLPFMNTSASYRFYHRHERFLVGAAGMLIEGSLALCAVIFWFYSEPGWTRDLLFNIAFIGSFSTLVFNANPLMKFDGYYLLSDAMGVLNLNEQSRQQLSQRLKRCFYGIHDSGSQWGGRWLFLYAALATPYRVIVALSIAYFLMGKMFVFGVVLAIWLLVTMLFLPCLRAANRLWEDAKTQKVVPRFIGVTLGALLSVYFLLVVLPMGFVSTHHLVGLSAPGGSLRAQSSGVIQYIGVQTGDQVIEQTPLVKLNNPVLIAELTKARAHAREYQALLNQARIEDRAMVSRWEEALNTQKVKVQELERQVEALWIYSRSEGEVVLDTDLARGSFVHRGDSIGYLQQEEPLRAILIAKQHHIERIRTQLAHISVVFTSLPDKVFSAQLLTIKPVAQSELSNKYLGSMAGGDVVVDPRDQAGTAALETFFEIELTIDTPSLGYVPATGIARLSYHKMPLLSYVLADIHTYLLNTFE